MKTEEILILIFSYLLGSLPFGLLFSLPFGKNPLKVGWKKTSASNVFKNVGKIPGILTGIFDLLKGYFPPKLAQILGFDPKIQVLCAFLAIVGHNWSIFLRFAGGRGIGTLVGALFYFSFWLSFFAFFPTVFFALFFDSSLATLFFIFYLIFLSKATQSFETTGFLLLLSLFPIFLKRLSPLKEALSQKNLILPRILFDDDKFHEMRILKFLRKKANEK